MTWELFAAEAAKWLGKQALKAFEKKVQGHFHDALEQGLRVQWVPTGAGGKKEEKQKKKWIKQEMKNRKESDRAAREVFKDIAGEQLLGWTLHVLRIEGFCCKPEYGRRGQYTTTSVKTGIVRSDKFSIRYTALPKTAVRGVIQAEMKRWFRALAVSAESPHFRYALEGIIDDWLDALWDASERGAYLPGLYVERWSDFSWPTRGHGVYIVVQEEDRKPLPRSSEFQSIADQARRDMTALRHGEKQDMEARFRDLLKKHGWSRPSDEEE